jgi:hypothetical protein
MFHARELGTALQNVIDVTVGYLEVGVQGKRPVERDVSLEY